MSLHFLIFINLWRSLLLIITFYRLKTSIDYIEAKQDREGRRLF